MLRSAYLSQTVVLPQKLVVGVDWLDLKPNPQYSVTIERHLKVFHWCTLSFNICSIVKLLKVAYFKKQHFIEKAFIKVLKGLIGVYDIRSKHRYTIVKILKAFENLFVCFKDFINFTLRVQNDLCLDSS